MMNNVIRIFNESIVQSNLNFSTKPLLVGGLAMEYYGLRKSGADIDLIITDCDYKSLAQQYPEKTKDLYGDLGLVIDKFEIWRSIAHLDYDFFIKDAIEEENMLVISIDRLLWSRVCAMDVEKYRNDLLLIKDYYFQKYTNQKYHQEALVHEKSYAKMQGVIFGGRYEDDENEG
ncbi:hypothetical protein J2Z32_002430 [Paenibacillus turicensis]|uniref:Polymerase nucleotidyl transferase domain-containing protein n=2 Tax=Paenibacillus turicensis TaxID=160487 RepID=A0ABS4FT76_9BACL|nr:hypothetical protein [Paenibacillus turicensis]